MAGKHNKGCCDVSCIIAEDDFNRNGSDLGSGWTHPTGDWITVATGPWINGYAEAQVDGAIAINNTPHPVPDESGVVVVDIIGEVNNSGKKYRAVVNAVDKDNYHYAEYIRNDYNSSVLRLGVCVAGTDTILISEVISSITDPVGEPRSLTVMISDNEFCATVSLAILSLVWVEESPIAGGYYAGFGGDEGTQFSHWTYLQHRQTKLGCPACLCDCEENHIPPRLYAHIAGTGRMVDIDCDLYLEFNKVDATWYSDTETCCNNDWKLSFTCPDAPTYDLATAKITVLVGCIDSLGGVYYLYANPGSTCEPINLVFGPFGVAAFDLACGCFHDPFNFGTGYGIGEYYITLTEAP